mgnify:FL=1|tara:strand:- start:342 stop:743 length:402 start_codon:yes stop_codon:yes gene_type:complete
MSILEKEVGRKLEDTYNYRMRKKLTNELYGDYQKLLKIRLFNDHESYVIKKNMFPYDWKEEDYKHDCLWINPKVEDRWTENMIIDLCKRHYRNNEIIYLFENEMDARSVLKIRHFHIIYKLDYSVCNKLKCKI